MTVSGLLSVDTTITVNPGAHSVTVLPGASVSHGVGDSLSALHVFAMGIGGSGCPGAGP